MKTPPSCLLLASALLPAVMAGAAPLRSQGKAWCATARDGARNATWSHAEERGRRGGVRIASVAADQDVGEIAVLEDQGDLALLRNLFDLQGAALRFTPSASGFSVSRISLPMEAAIGTSLALGDDDTRRVPLSFAFPFFGRSYSEVFVNSDGNLTFGQGDDAATSRTVGRLVSGPPRIAPLLADLNPEVSGSISGREASDHYTVTWTGVPQYGRRDSNTFQATLWSDGRVDFVFAANTSASIEEGAVGLAPGGSQGGVASVDFANAAVATGNAALAESFRADDALDTVAVARRFYATHPDDYEQLVIYTSRGLAPSGVFSWEETVRNADRGIGVDALDLGDRYGSAGRLESVVSMDTITKYPNDPLTRFLDEDSALSVLAHEVGHRWLAHAQFKDGNALSEELLGRDGVHWSFFTDTDGSFMEGNDIVDLGGGHFRTAGASLRYSALDQYLMGLRDAAEVGPLFFARRPFNTSDTSPSRTPRTGVSFDGARKDVTIADVAAALGARNPAGAAAKPPFRQAFIYVAVGGAPDPAALAKLERIRAAWPGFFAESTEGRGSVDPRLR